MVKKPKKAAAKKSPPSISEPIETFVTVEQLNVVVRGLNAAIGELGKLRARVEYLEQDELKRRYAPPVKTRQTLVL